jgi:hypothetical protein
MQFLAGVLGIERDGEYVRPRLVHAVAELEQAERQRMPQDGQARQDFDCYDSLVASAEGNGRHDAGAPPPEPES